MATTFSSEKPLLDAEVIAELHELGGEELIAELITLFQSAAAEKGPLMQAALTKGDAKSLGAAAHFLKSSSGNLGGLRLHDLLGKLEAAALAGDLTKGAEIFAAFPTEFESLRAALAARPKKEIGVEATGMATLQGREILIVDDAPDIRVLATKVLEGDGATVTAVETIDEAIAHARAKSPHLIITDLDLPGKNGFDFLIERRNIPELAGITTLVLSGLNDRPSVTRAISLGADDYILKPFRAALLIQKVKKAFHHGSFRAHRFAAHEQPSLTLSVSAELLKANEVGFLMESAIKLAPENDVVVSAALLEEMGCQAVHLRTTANEAKYTGPSRFQSEINFVGVGDPFAKVIRAQIKGWKRR